MMRKMVKYGFTPMHDAIRLGWAVVGLVPIPGMSMIKWGIYTCLHMVGGVWRPMYWCADEMIQGSDQVMTEMFQV